MKICRITLLNWLFLPLLLVLFVSCESKTAETITSKSPDEKVVVTVDGRKTPLNPWKVSLRVQSHDNFDETLQMEVYAEKLDESTVNIDWKSNSECTILFKQQDGSTRTLSLTATRNGVNLHEI